jgi:alpha-tubulin suppressor-like RCC1 family protein
MDGIAFCWGLNSLANSIPGGALGTNNVTDRSSPVAVTGSYTFKQISAGKRSTIALTTAGAAYTWGGNAGEFDASGQLGDGTTNPRSSPVAVIGGRTFVQVSMGDTHAAAIDSNGAAYCWGEGTNGQLGTGNTTYRSSPVAVIGGKVFTKIHAGQYRTLAIDTAGAVWAWGFNGGGQLGDGTITQRSSPVAVIGGRVFTDVFSGVRPSGGITTEGEAYAWGDNTDGALGTSSQTNRSSPVLVLGGRVWNTRNTEVLGSTVLTVVPGTTYPVVLFSETVRLGIETVSPSYGTPSSLVLEYFI